MRLIQQNLSDSVYLQECSEPVINTGIMTECVSIILLCNNTNFGIHCGGGITGGWDEKITNLFNAKKVKCYRMIAIFGVTYQGDCESKYLGYKLEAINNIKKGIGAGELEIYSASEFNYEILTGQITGRNCKRLEQNHWVEL